WGVHPQGKRHRFAPGGPRETARGEKGPRRNPADAWLVIPDAHEPLVDRDLFERVQARLLKNQALVTPQRVGGAFVLNRLLVCGHCGSFMTGVTGREGRVYVCRGYLNHGLSLCHRNPIRERPLLKFLLRALRDTFLDPENLHRLRQEMAAMMEAEAGPENLGRLRRRG